MFSGVTISIDVSSCGQDSIGAVEKYVMGESATKHYSGIGRPGASTPRTATLARRASSGHNQPTQTYVKIYAGTMKLM